MIQRTIYGNKKIFATRFELDIDDCCGSQWMLGKFCFYINNRRVGDPKMGATLSSVKEYLGDFVLHPQRAYSPKLFTLNGKRILKLMENIENDNGKAFYQFLGRKKSPDDFQLSIGEQFMDPYIFYKIDNDTYTKIIYGKYCPNSIRSKDHVIHSMMFLREQVDSVLKDTYTELQRIYDLLKAREVESASK